MRSPLLCGSACVLPPEPPYFPPPMQVGTTCRSQCAQQSSNCCAFSVRMICSYMQMSQWEALLVYSSVLECFLAVSRRE